MAAQGPFSAARGVRPRAPAGGRRLGPDRDQVPEPVQAPGAAAAVMPVTSATISRRASSSSIPEAPSTVQPRARASALTLSSGEAASTSIACDSRDVDRLARQRDTTVRAERHSLPSSPASRGRPRLPGHDLQKPDRKPLGIELSRLQRVAAGQRRQRLARDAALLEVKGQGGANRGPAALLANAVAQSQCRADQRRLPRPGPPKVGQTPVA